MGMFTSEDGLSSSLTDAELEALAVQFDQKVDQYYAADIYCNEFYKWLNRDCLFRRHQTVVDNCIAGGVTQCDITGLVLSDNRTKATAKATVVTWNKWVTQEEDGGYTVSNPINRDALEVIMVKEDGIWKLSETLSLEKGMTGYDSSVLESTKKDHFDEEPPKKEEEQKQSSQEHTILFWPQGMQCGKSTWKQAITLPCFPERYFWREGELSPFAFGNYKG